MKQAISLAIWAASLLFFQPVVSAATVTYYDCLSADGSISYRIYPCDKGQQELRRQKNTVEDSTIPPQVYIEPPVAEPVAQETPAQEPPELATAQQDFAAGEAALKQGKYEKAVMLYRKAAEQGYAPAQYNLGAMYEKGEGVAQDYPQAATWYRKAAEQDFVLAQFSMGVMYDIGQGVAQDYQQALFWYGKAADLGDAKAQNNLGFMYSQGKGVTRNNVNAHMWFNISGVRGYEEGRKNREFVEKLMTTSEISEAQMLATQWMKAHP